MRPNESFIAQPIRSLQTMLRVIAQQDTSLPSVIPDGIYGQDTVRTVSAFQRSVGLPVTGVADQPTWDAVVAYFEPALTEAAPAEPLEIILNPGQIIKKGEKNPAVYIAQAILMVLSEAYGSITPPSVNGILDIPTSDSIAVFQQLNRMPMTGELDKHTWKRLAVHYPMAVLLLTPPEPHED